MKKYVKPELVEEKLQQTDAIADNEVEISADDWMPNLGL